MEVIHEAWGSTDLPTGAVVTIGKYDGIHRGQQAILQRVEERAEELDAPSVVVTFDPHPVAFLRPGEAPPLLTTAEQKERLLAAAGIDALLVLRFDRALAELSAEAFVDELLVRRLRSVSVFIGRGFRFGRDREGNEMLLRQLGEQHGFTAEAVDEVRHAGAPISSTRIRDAVANGAVEEAAVMLGRPYEITGQVLRGDRMGQRLGWPTVNISPDHPLVPQDGVYATRIRFSDLASQFDAATNIGTRPTVYENYQRVVESHVLGFSSDVYGQRVTLEFHRRLREERIFPSIMELSAQIGRDVEATRDFFAARRQDATNGPFAGGGRQHER